MVAFCCGVGCESCTGSRVLEVRLRSVAQRPEQALGDGIVLRLGKRVHRLERSPGLGILLRELENRRIGNDPAARQIALARQFFAPNRERSGARARRRRQLLEAAQPLPRLHRIGLVEPGILECQTILEYPVFAPQCAQPLGQLEGDLAQKPHIIGRIFQLCRGERPPRPVGARLSFGQRHVEQRLDQIGVTDLRFEADASGGDLRVEDRRDHPFDAEINRLEILSRRVYELRRCGAGECGDQGFEAPAPQCIHAIDVTADRQLQQAQLREKSPFPQEFRVDAD